ncbi:GDSL esterase/lipase At1g29660-like [Silene latifolia]|uniref:GDSL esterase/lipase At1g29660-like n=1 Tax=Silene latifolia TaxID=37657 RepID=UPI003D7733CD
MAHNLYNSLRILIPTIFLLAFSCNVYMINAKHKSKLRGMFVFGSSVVDNGNNNNNKIGRGNYLPYGIDYPKGPTGRFSNGKNVADQIAEQLHLPPSTPFLVIRNHRSKYFNRSGIVPGVNFAAGASGILQETSVLTGVKSMGQQIKNFKNLILPQLERHLDSSSENILSDYLFMVAAGNNDYSYYHVLHQDLIWNKLVFAAKLVSNYFGEIKTLYNVGARKFLLLSVYPVGCNPVLTKHGKHGKCIHKLNQAVDLYYEQLVLMVMQGQQDMPDAQFCVVNSAKIILNTFKSANKTGFTNIHSPCCETTESGTCKKGGKVCPNRKEYFYYDGLHLTEAASRIIAARTYHSTDDFEVYPKNLKHLVANKD